MAALTYLTNAGRAIITNRISGAGTEPKYLGWGTGAATADPTNTAIASSGGTEQTADYSSPGTRNTGTSSRTTVSVTNDNYQVVGTIVASTTRSITCAALFDATTSGNMFIIGSFDSIALNTNDAIQFTFGIQFT